MKHTTNFNGHSGTMTRVDLKEKRKFSFFATALLKMKKDKKEMPSLNFSSRFLSNASFSTFAVYFLLCVEKITHNKKLAKPPTAKELNPSRKTKTRAKKICLPAGASWTVACILTVIFSAETYGQIQSPQTPQFEKITPVNPNQSYPSNNSNQQYKHCNSQYPSDKNSGKNNNSSNFHNHNPKKAFEEYNALKIEEKRTEKPKYSVELLNAAKYYQQVFGLLSKMENGSIPYNFKQAVFNIENAYFDNTIPYETFDKLIQEKVKLAKQFMKKENMDTSSMLSKNYAIQLLYSKPYTTKLQNGTTKTIKPLSYDFKDYRGDTTWTNMFVSKLLKSGKGQCHSMPQLGRILADELGTTAKLVYAPEHLYLKFLDNNNQLYNFEATNGCNTTEQFILESGYISGLAVKNKIYMDTLNQKRELSLLFFDLAQGLREKTGYSELLLEYINKAIELDHSNIHAISMKADYYTLLTMRGVKYYNIKSENEIQKYPDLAELFKIRDYLYDMIDDSGYQQMPREAYEGWLKQLNTQKRKQESEEINKLILKQIKN